MTLLELVSTRLPSDRCQMCTRNPFYSILPKISSVVNYKVFRKFVLHSVMTLLVSSRLPSGRCKSATDTDGAPNLFSGKLRHHVITNLLQISDLCVERGHLLVQ